MPAERIITEDLEALAEQCAEWISRAIREAITRDTACTLALTGGATVLPVYTRLASLGGSRWGSVTIFFGDERGVPPDHPDSNYRLAQETLLAPLAIPA